LEFDVTYPEKTMELKNAIEGRTSVRSFLPDPVPLSDIREMVRLAGLAPSVNNFQPWSFILITNRLKINEMASIVAGKLKEVPLKNSKLTGNIMNQVEWYSTFFKDAPAVLAVVLHPYESVWEKGVELSHEEINRMRNYPDIQSAGACIQTLLLAAVDLGYGACWLSGPMIARHELEELLEISAPQKLLSFVGIGKPSRDFMPKEKQNLAENLKMFL
jgi:nitroreductase